MEKVLVTGGAGFIGSHLVARLRERNASVVVLDNLSSGSLELLEGAPAGWEFVQGDVLDAPALLEGRSFDVVYHLAALISGHDSLQDPDAYLKTNVTGLLRLVDAVGRPGTHVVFASSSTVYGGRGGLHSEADAPAPVTVYALSKLAGEHLLSMYAPLRGFTHTSLRLFNVYGPHQSPDHAYANVTCKFAKAAAAREPVVLFGDGAQSRDFVFVDDVVRAFLDVSSPTHEPVYNVGTGLETSIAQLLELAGRLSGRSLDVDRKPPWPNDVRSVRANTRRYVDAFGPPAPVDLEAGLGRTIAWFAERAER